MAARRGRRSRTARCARRRWARSPCRSRTRTSSSSGWARRAFAATSWLATACTNRPTRGRRGRTSDLRSRRTSRRSAFIPPTRTSSGSRPSASTRRRTQNAASTRAPTAARVGAGCCSATTRRRRSTSAWIAATRTCFTRRCGRRTGSSTRCRAAGREAGFGRALTAVIPGRTFRTIRGCRRGCCSITVPIGLISAMKRNSLLDHAAMGLALIGQSAPTFFLGILFILLLALKADLFPTSGRGGWLHLVLPALTLGAFTMASIARRVNPVLPIRPRLSDPHPRRLPSPAPGGGWCCTGFPFPLMRIAACPASPGEHWYLKMRPLPLSAG